VSDEPKDEPKNLIPRPQTVGDLIVVTFVGLVSFILILLSITAVALTLFTDQDVKPFLTIVTDLVSTLIAALVGYLAGKSSNGHSKS